MAMVNKHEILPSWNNQEVTAKVGASLTLKDSNSVLTDMTLESNATNAGLKQNGNIVILTLNPTSSNGIHHLS